MIRNVRYGIHLEDLIQARPQPNATLQKAPRRTNASPPAQWSRLAARVVHGAVKVSV
jgi:hypothetical protein